MRVRVTVIMTVLVLMRVRIMSVLVRAVMPGRPLAVPVLMGSVMCHPLPSP